MGKIRTALQSAVKLMEVCNANGERLSDAMLSAATNVDQSSRYAGSGVDELFLFAKTAPKKMPGNAALDEILWMKLGELSQMFKDVKTYLAEIERARDTAVKFSQIWGKLAKELKGVIADLDRLTDSLAEIEGMINAKAKKAAKDKNYKVKYDSYLSALKDLQKKVQKKRDTLQVDVLMNEPPSEKQLTALYNLKDSSTLEDLQNQASRSLKATLQEAEAAVKSGEVGAKKFRNVNIAGELKSINDMMKAVDE